MVSFGLKEPNHISIFMHHCNFDHPHLLLPGLKYVAAMQEKWLHLVNTPRGNKDKVEDCKEPQLEGKSAASNLPEGKSTEESGKNMEEEFVPHVVLIFD
jgi:hypothetical protein